MRFPKKNYYKLFTIEYEMMRPIHFVFDIEVRKLIEVIQCNALLNFNYGIPFKYFVKAAEGEKMDEICCVYWVDHVCLGYCLLCLPPESMLPNVCFILWSVLFVFLTQGKYESPVRCISKA